MLCSLHIENIAVIKSADIDFTGGFTVLTGETGAGKSIIIDSINLILGAKQSRDLIRSGEESATVSAVFGDLSPDTLARLHDLGLTIDEDGLVLFQRTISASGKSAARINGRTVPLSLLRDATGRLIAIHGQHDNMTLLQPENHILYLDEFAGLGGELAEYEKSYDRYLELNRSINELTKNEREKARKIEFLKFQISEIEAAKPSPDEEEQLLKKRARLQNLEQINRLSGAVYAALYQSEKGTAAIDKIKRSIRALDSLSAVIPNAAGLSERLEGLSYELEDIALTAAGFADDSDGDPTAQLDRIESRLDEIAKLERKYGDTAAEVLAFLAKAKRELSEIELTEERLAELYADRIDLLKTMKKQAGVLSEKREAAAKLLGEKIIGELAYLDMKGVSFGAEVKRRKALSADKMGTESAAKNEAESHTEIPSQTPSESYSRRGVDEVEFLISTNRGEPMKPLAKIASGGELARIMLAVKSVLADRDSIGTLIFDEVDTGVSGKTSQKIGYKLRMLARSDSISQVLCVTHSAQIAALADTHCLIAKHESGGRVSTTVTPLDTEGRVHEVARIMGGITITDRLIETAREMINEKTE